MTHFADDRSLLDWLSAEASASGWRRGDRLREAIVVIKRLTKERDDARRALENRP